MLSYPHTSRNQLQYHQAQPRFSALICHTKPDPNHPGEPLHCSQTDVRIFRFELTNDTSQYPLNRVVCPQAVETEGINGTDDPWVGQLAAVLPQLTTRPVSERLEIIRNLIRAHSKFWQIGHNRPTDTQQECLADRGNHLLQQSTADIQYHPQNNTYSMNMDYDDPNQKQDKLIKAIQTQNRPMPIQTPQLQAWV